MSAFHLGQLFGSIVLTGLISRVLDKYTCKTFNASHKAYMVALLTIAICTVLGSFNFGAITAFLMYGVGTVVWLCYDLTRAH